MKTLDNIVGGSCAITCGRLAENAIALEKLRKVLDLDYQNML